MYVCILYIVFKNYYMLIYPVSINVLETIF